MTRLALQYATADPAVWGCDHDLVRFDFLETNV